MALYCPFRQPATTNQTMKNINIEKVASAKIMVNEFLGDDNCDEETLKEREALFFSKEISVTSTLAHIHHQ